MKPVQLHPGHYWKTDDPADLDFNEAGKEAPQFIRCYSMNDYINRGEARDVPVAWLEYLAAGIFGGPRPSVTARIRWSGDSHRYGIYRNLSPHGRHSIILLERHGGGMVGYQFDQSYAIETWEALARTLAPEMIWNLCNQIAESCQASRAAERSNMHRAFLEGRMKKRRRNHRLWVDVEPPASANRSEVRHGLPED